MAYVSPFAKIRDQQNEAPPPDSPSVWAALDDSPINKMVQQQKPQTADQVFASAPKPQVISAEPLVASPEDENIQHDQQQLQKVRWNQEHPWGTPENHPGKMGKVAHVFSSLGNIAGDIFAPGVMARIPGTQAYMQEQEGELANRLESEVGKQSENKYRNAETAKTEAEQPFIVPKANAELNRTNAETQNLQSEAESRKEPDLAKAYAHAVNQAILRGDDPAQDPIVQHLGDAITAIQRQPVPKGFESKTIDVNGKPVMANFDPTKGKYYDPTTGAEIPNAVAYEKPPAVPGITVMVPGPNGTQTVQRLTPGQTITPGTQELKTGLNAPRQDVLAHDKAYVQPAEAVEKSYQMMDNAYREYEDARAHGKSLPTGAQSMLALSTHLSTTFGNVKGARVTKDMIHEHLGARSIGDDALVAVQKLTNGDQLSPEQWKAFHELIKQSRNLSWSTAVKEAARKHIPMDFLPPDLQTITKDGKTYQIGPDGQYHAGGQ